MNVTAPPKTTPRPVVEGYGTGATQTRGVDGFKAPGQHKHDVENAEARAAAGEDAEVDSDGKLAVAHTAHPEDPAQTLTGKIGADGLARATFTNAAGIEAEKVWNPEEE